jgi:muramidase (phage lysozyme)
MPRITAAAAGGQNVCALLDTIAFSEIGTGLLADPSTDDGYLVLVGATPTKPLLFQSYAAHPDVFNTRLDSTAAGRYQQQWRNWVYYQRTLALPDFGPVSQDKIAIEQIREAGGISLINAGQFAQAIAAIAHLWASLPGANYGQHEQLMGDLQGAYVKAGGLLA